MNTSVEHDHRDDGRAALGANRGTAAARSRHVPHRATPRAVAAGLGMPFWRWNMPPKKTTPPKRIVSSAHLADNPFGALSELEFALSMVVNAYQRWMVRCMAAAGRTTMGGGPELGALDVLVLHHVYHRDRPKRLTDLALVLNIEDHHTINYALKKLARLGLIHGERKGKEVSYAATERGRELCDTYRQVREQCLIESFGRLGVSESELSKAASLLRGLSGIYDQAARAVTSL